MQPACYPDSLTSMDEQFPGNWLHGFLDIALLSLLASERDYGYGLTQRLAAAGLGGDPDPARPQGRLSAGGIHDR